MQQTEPRFGCLVRPPAWKRSGATLVEREGMDNRRKWQSKREKGKSNRAIDEEVNGQVRKKTEKGVPQPGTRGVFVDRHATQR